MMAAKILSNVDPKLLEQVNIIHSRVRPEMIHPTKKNILVLHDTWDDPESEHLSFRDSRERFAKLVFVSNYQQATYNIGRGVPYGDGVVIQNAIDPIDVTPEDKESDKIRLIYHTTPHRGLELLVPCVERLAEIHPNIHLDVYSSFNIYGWPGRDEPYKALFERIDNHPNMTYRGFQSNETVREALKKAHIYAYPCIWPETSCISAIEAMSAGCFVVTTTLAALPETTANFASMCSYDENWDKLANRYVNLLNAAIFDYESVKARLEFQKIYTNGFYNWDLRSAQWNAFLGSILSDGNAYGKRSLDYYSR
jgi:glycosyltransferase involved in cell wall biosynthesis